MRGINFIVLHCTATPPTAKVEAIQSYWRNALRWKSPGYHYIIKADGTVQQLAQESAITNGVENHNRNSIHISYIGGIDRRGIPLDTRTPEQKATMERLVRELQQRYPGASILGHRDFPGVAKACPSFDVKTWLKEIDM